MELSERNLQTFEKEGFTHVYEVFDDQGKEHEEHSHSSDISLLISEGSMKVSMNGESVVLNATDRLDIKANEPHSIIVGEEGCKYVIGEM